MRRRLVDDPQEFLRKAARRARGLRIAPDAAIERGVRIRVHDGDLRIGRRLQLHEGLHIAVVGEPGDPARCEIGDSVSIGARCIINVSRSLSIGSDTQISWNVQILDSDFHHITFTDRAPSPMRKDVVIGKHVLIGTGAIVLKGVRIGDGAVIAAGSVVTRDVEAGWLAAGNPARPVRAVESWT